MSDLQAQVTLFLEEFGVTLRGFHSPQDEWSAELLGVLAKLGFDYDIAVEKEVNQYAWLLRRRTAQKAHTQHIRIPSLGDDWGLTDPETTPAKVLERWQAIQSGRFHGRTVAMGFHPWIIGQQTERIDVFETFIEAITNDDSIGIYTGAAVADWYRS
jgi:hypothetical protein